MSKKSLLILLMALNSWLPWTHEAKSLLQDKAAIVVFSGVVDDYARGRCCDFGPPSFTINSNCAARDVPMVALHETQHLLLNLYASSFLDGRYEYLVSYEKGQRFAQLAIGCAKRVEPQGMPSVMKFAGFGTAELHAQLPWLLHGKLCPELQGWYPWFDLSGANQVKVKHAG